MAKVPITFATSCCFVALTQEASIDLPTDLALKLDIVYNDYSGFGLYPEESCLCLLVIKFAAGPSAGFFSVEILISLNLIDRY